MPQSLHVLSVHIIFSTKERRPWLTRNIRERVWAYQSRILQNLECNSITIGGAADHVHVLCNLTRKFSTAKVVEILKKDSSKFMKTLGIPSFHWQDGYGLFSVSSSHFRGGQEIHSRSRRAPQKRDIPRRIFADSEKMRRALQRTIFVGLNSGMPFQGRVSNNNRPRALPSATMAQAVGLPSEIGSHCCSRFKRNARSDFVSASSNALRNCSAAVSRLFNRISSSPITE